MSDKPKAAETMVVDSDDTGSAGAIAAQAAHQSATLMANISERTRTLCLGALVTIWGILSQKKGESPFNPNGGQRRVLIAIALCAVIVLALDFVEYLAAFQRIQKLAGTSKVFMEGLDYEWWEKGMRRAKLVLGALTLLALCVTVGYIILTPVGTVHAQSSPETAFLGTWCGGMVLQGTYSCLDVKALSLMESGADGARLKIRYSFQTHPWIPCQRARTTQARLTTECGKGAITVDRVSTGVVQLTIVVGGRSIKTFLSRVH
jgi:hypothetical protein